MQSLTLKSDMEAFKAANPGCKLEDFVRWHSPRDWIGEEGQPPEAGHLSDRMSHADNIWQVMWREAMPIPVFRQRPLFDCTAEAEKALTYLEAITPRELVWQLTPPLLVSARETEGKKIWPFPDSGQHLARLYPELRPRLPHAHAVRARGAGQGARAGAQPRR